MYALRFFKSPFTFRFNLNLISQYKVNLFFAKQAKLMLLKAALRIHSEKLACLRALNRGSKF